MSPNNFTIHHLPYGVVTVNNDDTPCLATAYGEFAINLAVLVEQNFFEEAPNSSALGKALRQPTWNAFAALDSSIRQSFRAKLKSWLQSHQATSVPIRDAYESAWVPLSAVTLHYPMQTSNYSDFYCSHEHAKNCSAVFNLSVAPTWYIIPQVYNGRTSSLAVSGTPVIRPVGVFPLSPGSPPSFQPETKFDFELEMGIFVSKPLPRGQRLHPTSAKDHIFGIALLNDWSARAIQFFEIQPLGPFHSKGALTSVAAWITPIEALDENAQCPRHAPQNPPPFPHLAYPDTETATWNVHISASVIRKGKEYTFSRSNLNELHWTPLQMLAHLASAGEGLSPGDIFGTGTLSSARTNQDGEKTGLSCIWERQLGDAKLKGLPEGVAERLLEDGDEVVLTGWCEDGKGKVLFELGECRGKVLPAVEVGANER